MAHTPDGGPAHGGTRTELREMFDGEKYVDVTYVGLTIRDYMAAKALPQAIEHERSVRAAMIRPESFRFDDVADAAYKMADAMLKARAAQSPAERQAQHLSEFGQ